MKKLIVVFLSLFLLGCSSISSVPAAQADSRLDSLSPPQPNPTDTPDEVQSDEVNEQMAVIQDRPVFPA